MLLCAGEAGKSGDVKVSYDRRKRLALAYFRSDCLRNSASSPDAAPVKDGPDDRRALSNLVARYARLCFDVHLEVVQRETGRKRSNEHYYKKFPADVRALYGNALSAYWFDAHFASDDNVPNVGKLRALARLLKLDGLDRHTSTVGLPWHWIDDANFAWWHDNPVVQHADTLIALSDRIDWVYDCNADCRISPLFDQLYHMRLHPEVVMQKTSDIVALSNRPDLNPETLRQKVGSIMKWGGCTIL